MSVTSKSIIARQRRRAHVRKHVSGSAERPRLAVFRSNSHIYAQIIDDLRGHTLVAASTLDPSIRGELAELDKKGAAKKVGALVGARAKDAGISRVVFDRGGYKYHGRVAAVAEGAREAGLDF